MNNDCFGWLSISGTNINYPVMHTPNNPQEYLHKNFYGEYSQNGVPFLDSRCAEDSSNLIVYGHNMNNGTMFADLNLNCFLNGVLSLKKHIPLKRTETVRLLMLTVQS